MVSPHVEPIAFRPRGADIVAVEVVQTVRDLAGLPLTDQPHGLCDKTILHVFRFDSGRIERFDIEDDGPAA